MILLCFQVFEKENNSSGDEREGFTSYAIPLKEIEEKLEYMYQYENMLFGIGNTEFSVLGKLPEGEGILVHIYLEQEENRILFLPDEKANVTVNEEVSYRLYYEEEKKEYYYFTFSNRFISEEGIPVLSPDSGLGASIQVLKKEELDGIIKLGEVKVNFIKEEITLPPIKVESNEYIEALIDEISRVLREGEYYGTYELYIERLGRSAGRYEDSTGVQISAVLIGQNLEQYIYAMVDNSAEECRFPFLALESDRQPSVNFFTSDGYFLLGNYEYISEELILMVPGLKRGKIVFEVMPKEREEEHVAERQIEKRVVPDHREISLEESVDYIEYACSYAEWFGMYELGYREGNITSFQEEEIAVYATEDKILFVPISQAWKHTFMIEGETTEYYLAEDEAGGLKFYYLRLNPYAVEKGQLGHTLVTNDWHSVAQEIFHPKDLITGEIVFLGNAVLNIRELSELVVEEIEKDECIAALERYVKIMLKEVEETGKYTFTIGEYEAFGNSWCISAAIQGDREYYVRFLITETEDFHFWPVGFGPDGSLEECEAEAHHMNQICIDRTVELNRYVSEIVVE